MVDFREIRIGNYLLNEVNMQCAVGGLTPVWITLNRVEKSGVVTENRKLSYDEVFPIPITAEILNQIGFIQKSHTWKDGSGSDEDYWFGDFFISDEEEWFFLFRKDQDNPQLLSRVEYIHQLQNLYFALTGKELTL